jgi:hypothetical protein
MVDVKPDSEPQNTPAATPGCFGSRGMRNMPMKL